MIVVIPCGGKKRNGFHPAKDLYVGSYFVACRRAAEALGAPWVILSGKHGLVEPGRILAPYEQRLDARGSIGREVLKEQATALGMMTEKVVVLAGASYVARLREVVPHAIDALRGVGGMGKQMGRLKRIRTEGRL